MTRVKLKEGFSLTYPGIPPDSSLFAMSTSQDQTSNCHFRRPNTPHSTEPEWIPIRMSTSCFVLDLTYLSTQVNGDTCMRPEWAFSALAAAPFFPTP